METLALFLTGLFGGVHCVGMCGGIVSVLGFNISQQKSQSSLSLLPILLGYNLGRISSYMLAGALMGGISAGVFSLHELRQYQTVLSDFAALFMIILGLYLANIWRGLVRVESLGKKLWRHIEPLSRRFIPVNNFSQAVPVGIIWGWLPCGMVYSALIMALSSGSSAKGATLMLAFGLGTLANLLAMGFIAGQLAQFTRKAWVKMLAGILVMVMGLVMLLRTHL
jgi:sulfite exporter TauE/SafE